ncbi:MAG: hypothetical protein ACYT04_37600 [Nostoc sp.]
MIKLAERITITIPDNLHKRLQVVKNALNVSGVCQEALEMAIRVEELKREKPQNMGTLIERLQIEKQQDAEQWKEEGVIEGKKDASNLSYKEFKELESKQSITDDLTNWIEENHFEYMEGSVDKDAFLEGWLEGVLSIWDEVKELL